MSTKKSILVGIAIFALLGGALALKARNKISSFRVYTSYSTFSAGIIVTRCATINFVVTTQGGNLSQVYLATTTPLGRSGIFCITTALTTTNITTTFPGS